MPREINLLIKKTVISPQIAKIASVVQKSAIVILAIFILITASLFGYRFYEGQRFEDLSAKIEITKQQIESDKSTESIYLAYVDKANQINTILGMRSYPNETYQKVEDALGPNTFINKFATSGNLINLTVSAGSVTEVETITDALLYGTDLSIKEVTMEGLDKTEEELLIDFTIMLN